MPAERLLQPLSPDQRRLARREVLRLDHRLDEMGLFGDASLAELIDLHPRAATTVRTVRPAGSPREAWISGAAEGVSGAQLLKVVKTGQLQITLEGVMSRDPACRLVFDRLLAEFRAATGVIALEADAAIVISSPRLAAPQAIAPVETALWQVHGGGMLYVYPAGPDAALPWTAMREDTVTPVMLRPRQAAFLPLHSPYRTVNGDQLEVAIVLRFATPQSKLAGVLRQLLGRPSPAVSLQPDPTPRFDITAKGLVWREGLAPHWAMPAKPLRKPVRKRPPAAKALKAA